MPRAILKHATVILICALVGGPALAAGGAGRGETETRNRNLVEAEGLVEKERYADAIPLLQKVVAVEPRNADAYNYLGFSHRKLGDRDKALAFYGKALDLEPKHRGANEYLGELYLEMGDLAKAEERLEVLDSACWFGCEEYSELKEAIEAYKERQGS